jgi:hypothetical protein
MPNYILRRCWKVGGRILKQLFPSASRNPEISGRIPVWGFSPAGASGFFLGLDELSEVRALTQTFNAEYGGHGGAVIDMITKF